MTNLRNRKYFLLVPLLSILILMGGGCGKTYWASGTQLTGIILEYNYFSEFGARDSWVMKFRNSGGDLHNCTVVLDERFDAPMKKILIDSGFMGLWKKPFRSDIFKKGQGIEMANTSDSDQDETFGFPRKALPATVTLRCDEGEDTWELQ